MLNRNIDPTPACGTLRATRRQCLGAGLLGGLALAASIPAIAAAPSSASADAAPALLVITLSGGLSHLDSFDPKPEAPLGIRGRFPALPTALPGIRFTSLLPGLARRADRLAIIRSMTHAATDHEAARALLAAALPLPVTPVAEETYSGLTLPGLRPPISRISCPADVDGEAPEAMSRILELDRESPRLLARYGPHPLGRRLLQAQRLLASGTRCIHVLDEGWDHHAEIFVSLREPERLSQLDRALSALLDDLEENELLSRTLVAVVTEFGRSPRLNRDGGRDHHPHAYTQLLAGGGIRGGRVVGATDTLGEAVVERPVAPGDFAATIRYALDRRDVLPDLPAGAHPLRELF